MAVKLKRRLISVEEYHLMGEVGILNEKGIELINGEIIENHPKPEDTLLIIELTKLTAIILFES